MQLSETTILEKIAAGEVFNAVLEDGSLAIRVKEYAPYICTAIHAGHQLRDALSEHCKLSEAQRKQSESPYTDRLITPFPITVVALDSCYEYDLDADSQQINFADQSVWEKGLNSKEQTISRAKHACYYRILSHLIQRIELQHGHCLVFDIRSFISSPSPPKSLPLFKLNSHYIDKRRYRFLLKHCLNLLEKVELPNIESGADFNIHDNKSYHAQFVKEYFPKTLLIPIAVRKVYIDEAKGVLFPLVLKSIQHSLYDPILETVRRFLSLRQKRKVQRTEITNGLDSTVSYVDKRLYRLLKKLVTLFYVNPINVLQEKKRFFNRRRYEPNFNYRPLRLNPYELREELYRLPIEKITDPQLQSLYQLVVDSSATKIDMLTHIGSEQFLYNSLRYYGAPAETDIANAYFLLHAADVPNQEHEPRNLRIDVVKEQMQHALDHYGLQGDIRISPSLVAAALVSGKKVSINRNIAVQHSHLQALIQHELGVHLVTTLNAADQPLKLLSLGFPDSTYTQEGLAVLAEYKSGYIRLERLRQLALRVLAVKRMVKGESFSDVFSYLLDEYHLSRDEAFMLTTRVFRGGGFTKDYVYLKGFADIVKQDEQSLLPLYCGKAGLSALSALTYLVEQGILNPPKHLPFYMQEPAPEAQPVLDYLVRSLR